MRKTVDPFVKRTADFLTGQPLEPLSVNLAIGDFTLIGRIDGIFALGLVRYRCTKIKTKDIIGIWIRHLLLNCLQVRGYPTNSVLIGFDPGSKEKKWLAQRYAAISQEKAETELVKLLKIYWQGLAQPLPFFPKSSGEYAKYKLIKGKEDEEALKAAHRTWEGAYMLTGECEDAYYHCCFRYLDPIDEDFQHIAEEVFRPIFKSIEATHD